MIFSRKRIKRFIQGNSESKEDIGEADLQLAHSRIAALGVFGSIKIRKEGMYEKKRVIVSYGSSNGDFGIWRIWDDCTGRRRDRD